MNGRRGARGSERDHRAMRSSQQHSSASRAAAAGKTANLATGRKTRKSTDGRHHNGTRSEKINATSGKTTLSLQRQKKKAKSNRAGQSAIPAAAAAAAAPRRILCAVCNSSGQDTKRTGASSSPAPDKSKLQYLCCSVCFQQDWYHLRCLVTKRLELSSAERCQACPFHVAFSCVCGQGRNSKRTAVTRKSRSAAAIVNSATAPSSECDACWRLWCQQAPKALQSPTTKRALMTSALSPRPQAGKLVHQFQNGDPNWAGFKGLPRRVAAVKATVAIHKATRALENQKLYRPLPPSKTIAQSKKPKPVQRREAETAAEALRTGLPRRIHRKKVQLNVDTGAAGVKKSNNVKPPSHKKKASNGRRVSGAASVASPSQPVSPFKKKGVVRKNEPVSPFKKKGVVRKNERCHRCNITKSVLVRASTNRCVHHWCERCVKRWTKFDFKSLLNDTNIWECPACFDWCRCAECVARIGVDKVLPPSLLTQSPEAAGFVTVLDGDLYGDVDELTKAPDSNEIIPRVGDKRKCKSQKSQNNKRRKRQRVEDEDRFRVVNPPRFGTGDALRLLLTPARRTADGKVLPSAGYRLRAVEDDIKIVLPRESDEKSMLIFKTREHLLRAQGLSKKRSISKPSATMATQPSPVELPQDSDRFDFEVDPMKASLFCPARLLIEKNSELAVRWREHQSATNPFGFGAAAIANGIHMRKVTRWAWMAAMEEEQQWLSWARTGYPISLSKCGMYATALRALPPTGWVALRTRAGDDDSDASHSVAVVGNGEKSRNSNGISGYFSWLASLVGGASSLSRAKQSAVRGAKSNGPYTVRKSKKSGAEKPRVLRPVTSRFHRELMTAWPKPSVKLDFGSTAFLAWERQRQRMGVSFAGLCLYMEAAPDIPKDCPVVMGIKRSPQDIERRKKLTKLQRNNSTSTKVTRRNRLVLLLTWQLRFVWLEVPPNLRDVFLPQLQQGAIVWLSGHVTPGRNVDETDSRLKGPVTTSIVDNARCHAYLHHEIAVEVPIDMLAFPSIVPVHPAGATCLVQDSVLACAFRAYVQAIVHHRCARPSRISRNRGKKKTKKSGAAGVSCDSATTTSEEEGEDEEELQDKTLAADNGVQDVSLLGGSENDATESRHSSPKRRATRSHTTANVVAAAAQTATSGPLITTPTFSLTPKLSKRTLRALLSSDVDSDSSEEDLDNATFLERHLEHEVAEREARADERKVMQWAICENARCRKWRIVDGNFSFNQKYFCGGRKVTHQAVKCEALDDWIERCVGETRARHLESVGIKTVEGLSKRPDLLAKLQQFGLYFDAQDQAIKIY